MIDVVGFHIEPTNICTLKCSGCARTRFIEQWPQHWKNYNLNITDLLNFLDIDLSGISVNFCGNYGDPIYHPEFIDMVRAIKNRGAMISITTNGSYKKIKWWEQLCSILTAEDQIRFSIDGMPTSFLEYRENADWETIKSGIEVCTRSHVQTVWKFIPFQFNQSEIEKARDLSQSMGMTRFLLDPSDRYDEKTIHLLPANDLIGSRKSAQDQFKNQSFLSVDPRCSKGREHFITATGHYSPCCYIADHRFYYKTQFGKNKNHYNIQDRTFSEIIRDIETVQFMDSISTDPHKVCQFNCPRV